MVNDAPRFDADSAARIARQLYGIDATAIPLTSERDQNFLLTTAAGERRILKIANALERPELLEAQQAAMAHVAPHLPACPRPLPTLGGEVVTRIPGDNGRTHLVWAITHVPGAPLGDVRYRSRALLEDFGRTIASLDCALADFDHPAIHRDFHWDLANAGGVIDEYRPLVTDPELCRAIDTIVERFGAHVRPVLAGLPRRAIHNDLNDYNVLVAGSLAGAEGARVSGIVDFGDIVYSFGIADLAIAGAYMMLGADDPLAALANLTRGYAGVSVPQHDELQALFGLSAMRLAVSACIAAHQRRLRPDNEYLDVSQAAIRRTLPLLASLPFKLTTAALRDAAGLDPSPEGERVRTWLAQQRGTFAPVMPFDPREDPVLVLDLGVTSPLVSADPRENSEPLITARVDAAMREAGVRVAIGQYDEPRLLYSSPLFAGAESPLEERRTIHLGLDIFCDAGTPVHAPLRGTVHAFAYNPASLDYGGVIILQHATDDGTEFFSLYGHLSRASVAGVTAGRVIERAEKPIRIL